jgi:outer membrane protein insertion porin family
MRAWFLSLVILPLLAIAQSPSVPYPLSNLTIQGNKRFTPAQIIGASGLKIGQAVSKDNFDVARARLLETGAFESVGYEFKPNAAKTGYDATFDVAEVALLYPYRFEDLPAADEILRAALAKQEILMGQVIPATRQVLERYERTLTQAVGDKIKVEGKLNYDLPGDPAIVFRPSGERPRISEVHLTGNESVPATELLNKFADVAVGTEFSDAAVRRLLDASVRPMYEARGRVRVAFPKIIAEPSKQPEVVGVSLTVTVEEGPLYKLGEVHFTGAATKQAKELEDLVKWRKDDTINFDEIKTGLDRIVKRYKSTGYLHVVARADRTVNDKEHIVDLAVNVEAGPVFTFGKLEIRGLDVISEPAIRKMWGAKDGNPFDAGYPETFLKDVKDQGIFDNLGETTSQVKVNEDAKTVDVTLTFLGSKAPNSGRKRLNQFP